MSSAHDWLLLRGLGRQAGHWIDFLPQFEAALPGHRATALDLPGVGKERDTPSPTQIESYVDSVRQRWLQKRDPKRPAAIMAISLGGMVALDWLGRYPDDFSRAVIINTSARDLGPFWWRMNLKVFPRLFYDGLFSPKRVREASFVRATVNLADLEATTNAFMDVETRAPLSRKALFRQLFAAMRFRLPTELGVPLLVLGSEADHLVDVRCSKNLAKRFKAPIRLHQTAGHDLPRDAPDWVAQQIETWLRPAPQA